MDTQEIENIRKQFHHEWLLIAVEKMDEATTTPLTGQLLAHSSSRDEIYLEEMKHRGNTLTIYSEEGLPQGFATAFPLHDD